MKRILISLSVLAVVMTASGATPSERIDWPAFMARHDLVWEHVPKAWHEGAFIGNGLLGAMLYAEGANTLQWDVGRSDITDRGNRLAIGRFVLVPADRVTDGDMRLELWNAEAHGALHTDTQDIRWRSFTHAERPVTIVELGGAPAEIAFQHLPAIPAREEFKRTPIPENQRNPDPTYGTGAGGVHWCLQPFKAGGGYAVAWGERTLGGKRLFAFTVDATPTNDKAVADVSAALRDGAEALTESHRRWWHAYWPVGFLSIPDTRMESFYWIQMYKLASGTRANRPALDLMGPWFRRTPWPRIWWNLNIQLTYWPIYAANRLPLGESLTRMLDDGTTNLVLNVPESMRADSAGIGRTSSYDCRGSAGNEIGNLTWAMHNYWLQYRYSGDETMLRERLHPLLRRAAMYMVHRLETGPDGQLHFPVDISPEYPERAPDTNYNLALLRWALQTLLATNTRCGLNDPGADGWRDTLAKLTPFPVDETGYMIGAGQPLAQSHRHFSHLLLVYPLHLVNSRARADRPLIEKSLEHWIGFEGALQGYSFTGASAMSSWLDRKDAAVKLLDEFLDRYVKPNTMYLESGPVIETPLAGAAALHEILLQSWCMEPFGTDIRVFPAVPVAWKDVTIHKLRAEGAFEVSAARRDGRTQFVQIRSLAGAPCRVHTGLAEPVIATGARRFAATTDAGMTTIDLKQGETVLLTSGTPPGTLAIEPVPAQSDRLNYYGSHKVPAIRQDAQGNFTVTARQATLAGKAIFLQGKDDLANIGHWVDPADEITWKLDVTRPGTFRVTVSYAATGNGNRIALVAAGSSTEFERRSSGSWDTFHETAAGELTLPAGPVELRLRAADGKAPMINLRQIVLQAKGM